MPNRILRESICISESIDSLTFFEEVLFYRLIVNCDDYGRFDGRILVLKGRLFPLKSEISADDIKQAVQRLAELSLVVVYEVDGHPYLFLPTWDKFQIIRSKKSKYPSPTTEEYTCNQMNSDEFKIPRNPISTQSQSESISSESNPICNTKSDFSAPTLEEVIAFVRAANLNVDPEKFFRQNEKKGWMIGSERIKDWKKACRSSEQWCAPSSSPSTEKNDELATCVQKMHSRKN